MTLPLIGLTTFHGADSTGRPLSSIGMAYVDAVVRSGAVPVMAPLGLPEDALDALLERLDAIIFTGGGDIQPEVYGSQPHPLVDSVDPERDRVELHLARRVVERGKPFLGICRGLQVINVALGGTLYEDILDQRPGALQHRYSPGWPRDYHAHEVQVEPGSRMASILGKQCVPVNSLHHQGIRELGRGLRPCAYAPDRLIEAIELPQVHFGLAVQWHPECLPDQAEMQAIFVHLAQAARPS
jgi:putative glutamine amidotransferase